MIVRQLHIFKLFLSIAVVSLCSLFASAQDFQTTRAKRVKIKVLEEYPHSRKSYTQGLFFHDGQMYETTGQHGESFFIIVDYKSGKYYRKWQFPQKYFIEGSCFLNGRLYILTWMEKKCFVYNLPPKKKSTEKDFNLLAQASYEGEGWGLTTDGESLIMSNGSSYLSFIEPSTFYCYSRIEVTLDGRPLNYLNELEYIDGKIWANVYTTDMIVIIDPKTGVVETVLDCRGLLPDSQKDSRTDVLNGIAYNPIDKSIYITGKYWPKLYKITY